MGLFNWNNRVLVAHSVLNDYICAFTTSETPFTAWVTCMSRRYLSQVNPQRFLDQKHFRDIWFFYAQLIQFGTDTTCPRCGPNPSAVIWDGISISFNRREALSTLRLPTTQDENSPTYHETVWVKATQCITDRALRKRIRDVLNGPALGEGTTGGGSIHRDTEELRSDSDAEQQQSARMEKLEKAKEQLKKRFGMIPALIHDLKDINESLASLFTDHFGTEAVLNKVTPPSQYKDLYLQVSRITNISQRSFIYTNHVQTN